MQDTMLEYNEQGYSCSQRDLHNKFQDYADLLSLLNIGTNIPAVYFFHGSIIPPEQFFPDENCNGGFSLDNAWESNFVGARLYGSHAGKAAYYARPYLYLIMMLRDDPDWRHRSVVKVLDGSQRDIPEEVAIISTITKTGQTRYEGQEYYNDVIGHVTNWVQEVDETFAYPEVAICETGSLYQAGIIPLACFYLDMQFLGQSPEMSHLDHLRRERIPLFVEMSDESEKAHRKRARQEYNGILQIAERQRRIKQTLL